MHAIAFQEGGSTILTAGPAELQAWMWEPARRVGRVGAAWGCPSAVRTCGSSLLVASLQGPRLSLWSAALDAVRVCNCCIWSACNPGIVFDAKRATDLLVAVMMQVAAHAATPKPETQLPQGLRASMGLRSCMTPHTAPRRSSLPSGVQQATDLPSLQALCHGRLQ